MDEKNNKTTANDGDEPSEKKNCEKFDAKWTVRFDILFFSCLVHWLAASVHIGHKKFNLTKFNQKVSGENERTRK